MKIRTLISVAIGAVLLVAPMSVAHGANAGSNPLSAAGQQAFNQLSSCLSEKDAQLNVLYVLDASSSLQEDTDPGRMRGKILGQALKQMGSIAQDRTVNFAVSSFDTGYNERRPWQQLTQDNTSNAVNWADEQYGWWGTGQATDWEAALRGADQTMKKSPDFKKACKTIIWLTDGGINTGGKFDVVANTKAMESICGTDPANNGKAGVAAIVNSLRNADVHLIGVLLQSDAYLSKLKQSGDMKSLIAEQSKLSYVRPIAEGSGTVDPAFFSGKTNGSMVYDCGTLPDGKGAGALLIGDDPISLAYQFASLASRTQGGHEINVSDTYPVIFSVPQGINGVSMAFAGTGWEVVSPSGVIASESSKTVPAGVSMSSQGGLVTVEAVGEAVKPGKWTINVKNPKAPAQVFLEASIKGIIDFPDQMRLGTPVTFRLFVKDQISGKNLVREQWKTPAPILKVGQTGHAKKDVPCTAVPGEIAYECTWKPDYVGDGVVSAELPIETLDGQYKTTWVGTFGVPVGPSVAFPSVKPGTVQLSELNGKNGAATGTLLLVGPEKGQGEICFPEKGSFTVTEDVVDRADQYGISGPEWGSCVALEAGQTVEVPVSVTNPVAAGASVTGTTDVVLRSAEANEPATQHVKLTFDTVRKSTPPWWLLLGLVVIGLLVPIALLYFQARSASKLSMRGLQMATVPVSLKIENDIVRVTRDSGSSSDLFTLDDWQYLPSSIDRPRTFNAPSGVVMAAVVPRNPVGAISAVAKAPAGSRVVTGEGSPSHQPTGAGSLGRMGLNPTNQWFIVASESGVLSESGTFSGTLVGFTNPNGGDLAANSREMSLAVADLQAQGTWVTIKNVLRNPAPGKSVKPAKDSNPRKDKKSDNKTVSSVAETGAGTSDPNDPFAQTGSSSTASQGDPFTQGGRSSKPSTDPFGGSGTPSTPPTSGGAQASPPAKNDDDPFANL